MTPEISDSPRVRAKAAHEPTAAREVVRLTGLRKSYRNPPHLAVENLDLTVLEGEILSLLGPSGCGKTSLLRLIAGFEEPDEGSVIIGGEKVAGPGVWVQPERRDVGFVFQDYALFPHLNVLQNVAFGVRGAPRRRRTERAREILDLVGLNVFAGRYPHQLSGGQQQRVALARALAPDPEVILLDEPFSNLDAALRDSTRQEVRSILKRAGTTAVLVTHDQEEALTLGDRLAVMRAGRLEQIGLPEGVYKRPRTPFVARFLGRTNLIHGVARGDHAQTIFGDLPLTRPASGPVLLSLRPEDLVFSEDRGLAVDIVKREFKGHDLTFSCQATAEQARNGELLVVQTGPDCPLGAGAQARLVARGPAVPLEESVPSGGR